MIIFSKKNIVSILLVGMFSVVWFGVMDEAFGAEIDYTLLAPIPSEVTGGKEITNASDFKDLGGYLSFIFKAGIGIAGALAVLMLVIAGIEYMSPSANAKSEAKDRITSAIGGLLLALGSVLILTTINPNLLENFGIPKVGVTVKEERTYDLINEQEQKEIEEKTKKEIKEDLAENLYNSGCDEIHSTKCQNALKNAEENINNIYDQHAKDMVGICFKAPYNTKEAKNSCLEAQVKALQKFQIERDIRLEELKKLQVEKAESKEI